MTEHRLLSRLKQRDPKALEALIDQYAGYVTSIISAVLGARRRAEDVEELASDVFFAVWNHASALKPGRARAYIGTTARNHARNFLRKRQEMPMDLDELPALTSGDTPENRLLQQEQDRMVREAIEAMPPTDREIFLRFYYYYQPTAQIALSMGMEDSTVRVRLMRGRNLLKKKLGKEAVL